MRRVSSSKLNAPSASSRVWDAIYESDASTDIPPQFRPPSSRPLLQAQNHGRCSSPINQPTARDNNPGSCGSPLTLKHDTH